MTAFDDPSELARVPLFEGLDVEQLGQLNQLTHRSTFPSATRVMSAEQPGEAVYILLAGAVKVMIDDEDGHQITLAFLGPGDTVGEMSLVEADTRTANVVTLEESTFLWLDRSSFLRCLDTMPQLDRNLVSQLSARLRQANEKIRALTTMDVASRVARQLLAVARLYGQEGASGAIRVPLPLTQTEVAEMVGATRERVNRVMVDLKQSGVISVDSRHHLTIEQPDELKRRC